MDRSPARFTDDPEQDPLHTPRRAPRVEIAATTKLRSQGTYSVEVKLRNVSTFGFMAECVEPVLIGSYVALEVPGIGPVRAQVRWQIGVTMGGMFLDPINLARCEWTATKMGPA